jgi:hypothetical protein
MKKTILLFALSSLLLTACPKHEIIPAPEIKVTLTSSFLGTINGSQVELTQNVDGYSMTPTNIKTIFPSPTPSKAIYFAEMKSSQQMTYIKIGLGSLLYDNSVGSTPDLSSFNSFFNNNLTPTYKALADGGFEVTYRDGNGDVWTSDQASPDPKTVQFTSIVQESDSKGDYSKFTCTFSCTVYRTYNDSFGNPVTVSLPIQNAVFKGWFKR